MPQTFGPPGRGFALVDPRSIREHRRRFQRDLFPELDLANSYYSVSGLYPDVGWLLLDRNSLNQFDHYRTDLQLVIQDFVNPALTISNLSIVQARCVTMGLAADLNAIYFVQVTNTVGTIYSPWFQKSVNAQYNVRSPAYDTLYYSASLNSGTAWTWSTMLGNLWGMATTQLGTYPGLPITPTGTPEGFVFAGVPLWTAINRILDYLGLTVTGEYPSLSIAVAGAADTAYSAQVTTYAKYLEDSMDYIDTGSGRVPGSVVVYFHTRYKYYGSEETVRRDSYQWQSNSVYSVSVNAPSQFTGAAGIGYLWSDFTVRLDMDGAAVAADVTTAAAVAAERAAQFYKSIYRGTLGFMRSTYSGVLPFAPGSQVDGVRWYQTAQDDDGWRTEAVRGYLWPEVQFSRGLVGVQEIG